MEATLIQLPPRGTRCVPIPLGCRNHNANSLIFHSRPTFEASGLEFCRFHAGSGNAGELATGGVPEQQLRRPQRAGAEEAGPVHGAVMQAMVVTKDPGAWALLQMSPKPCQLDLTAVMDRPGIEARAHNVHGDRRGKLGIALKTDPDICRTRVRDQQRQRFVIEELLGTATLLRQDEVGDTSEPMFVLWAVHVQGAAQEADPGAAHVHDGGAWLKMEIIRLGPARYLTPLHHLVQPVVVIVIPIQSIDGDRQAKAGCKTLGELGRGETEIANLDSGFDRVQLPNAAQQRRQFGMLPMHITDEKELQDCQPCGFRV